MFFWNTLVIIFSWKSFHFRLNFWSILLFKKWVCFLLVFSLWWLSDLVIIVGGNTTKCQSVHGFKYHFLHSSSLVTWRQKCCLDQNWYWQPWLAQDSATKSAEFPTYPDILGPDDLQGELDFTANVVHFEIVCSNHKFCICQIAIFNCSIKVCIQQMLHGLKKNNIALF